jgi:hypothetical protein
MGGQWLDPAQPQEVSFASCLQTFTTRLWLESENTQHPVGEVGRIIDTRRADWIFETATPFGSKVVPMRVCIWVSGEGIRRAEGCWAWAA